MPRALCVRHHLEDHAGLIGEAFEARQVHLDTVLLDAASPELDVTGYDYLVILGSSHSVYDESVEAAWFHRELRLLADAERLGVPVLGICFGAQALCRHHGGVVAPAREAEIGWYDIDVEPGVALPAGPWFEYHYDACELPEGATEWARNERAVQAFSVGANVGVQFHPEIDAQQLAGWFAAGDDEPGDVTIDREALLQQTERETPQARLRALALVDLFMQHARRA